MQPWRTSSPTASCTLVRLVASSFGPGRQGTTCLYIGLVPPVDRNNPERAASSESRYSLMEFMADFPDDATCLDWLWRTRYAPDGENAECPKCETVRPFKRYHTVQQRQSWTCTHCGHHLHPTAGTIFHKSSTSLHLWWLFALEWGGALVGAQVPPPPADPFLPLPPVLAGKGLVPPPETSAAREVEGASPQALPT